MHGVSNTDNASASANITESIQDAWTATRYLARPCTTVRIIVNKFVNMLETPNLSQSFNPIPKPFKVVKFAKKVPQEGKKVKQWTDIRGELKKSFAKAGITSCEVRFVGCWRDNALTFAHLDKRRRLTKDDLYKVVLACIPCHTVVEAWNHEDMGKYLQLIIDKRNVKINVNL
jgi:uncharacterized protein YpbB